MKNLILQLMRFAVVGVIALLIDVGLLMLLKEIMCIDVLISSAISFSVSVTANYILSMNFVFESKKDNRMKEFVVFVLLSIGGLCLNQAIMWTGTKLFSAYYLYAKIFALVLVPVYNFVTRKIFLEKKTEEIH